MRSQFNLHILMLSEKLDCDYPYALGLYYMLREADEDGRLEALSEERLISDLGILSDDMKTKLSQIKRDILRDMIRDITCDIKRDKDRDRQRDYRERKRRGSSPPLPSIPPIPPITPQEKEREGNAPVLLHKTAPKGEIKRFSKPTKEQIEAYAQEIDFRLDAEAFLDYYETNGWMVGSNRHMKDWKAAIRNWKRRAMERGDYRHAIRQPDTESELTPEQLEAIQYVIDHGYNYG